PPMGLHAAAYDAATNTMIVFGGDPAIGFCFQATNDVWTLSNANGLGGAPQWTKLAPLNGSFPELRQRVRAVYDPTSQRLIAFGGMTQACGTSSNEVWILDGANGQSPVAWSQAHPAGTLPAPVVGHGMAYDQA